MNIVPTTIKYNSTILNQNLFNLSNIYPFLKYKITGYSVLNKPIYVIKLGTGNKKVFYSASIHANEWITSVLLMKFIEDFAKAYTTNSNLYGYSVNDIFNSTSIYIMPMVNPDGVDLVTNNFSTNSLIYSNVQKIASSFPNIPFPTGWKANINGVDLNLQFPAKWETAKKIKYSQGFNQPAPRDFVGYGPLTEPEALAINNFTLSNNFELVIAFHTQGQEIYWQFLDYAPPNAKYIGEKFSKSSGYTLTNVPYNSSFAGYKDWFIQNFNKPGFTVEAGLGENPLPISQFNKIYKDNIGILILGAI